MYTELNWTHFSSQQFLDDHLGPAGRSTEMAIFTCAAVNKNCLKRSECLYTGIRGGPASGRDADPNVLAGSGSVVGKRSDPVITLI